MKKFLVGAVLAVADIFYRGKKYKVPAHNAWVNLGCGLRCLPGWQNVDGSLTALFGSRRFSSINEVLYRLSGAAAHYSFPEYDSIIRKNGLQFYDLSRGVPFEDDSLDAVYTSHFLEHLSEKDGLYFLEDSHRALRGGGILRVLVPDLETAIDMYKSGKVDEMLRGYFYTSEKYDFHMHKYNYNFTTLSSRLEKIGFKNIMKRNLKEGDCPGIEYLDAYEGSLIIECRK